MSLPDQSLSTPATSELIRWIQVVVPASQLAERIAGTEFVPVAMRNKPEVVTACIMYGDELSIGPMQALASIHMIEGRPSPSAELMRALILRAGHSFIIHSSSGTACRVSGLRAGRPESERYAIDWTIDAARSAGLLSKAVWQRYPRAMLLARATGDLARAVFADVIKGLGHVADDLETAAEFDVWARGYDDATDAAPVDPSPRTAVARKPRKRAPSASQGQRKADRLDTPLPEVAPEGQPEESFDPWADAPDSDALGDNDPWARPAVAPAPDPPEAPPAKPRKRAGPAMVGASTTNAIATVFHQIPGITDDDETRLRLISAIVGKEIASSNDLTRHEGFRVLRIFTDLQTGAARWELDAEGNYRVWPADEPPPPDDYDQPELFPPPGREG